MTPTLCPLYVAIKILPQRIQIWCLDNLHHPYLPRGCFCAEEKAKERAAALDTLADDGRPPRWAYQMAPYPNYVGPIAASVAHMKHRHALELAREVARALRTSSESAAEQGQLNWLTVQRSYGDDVHSAERAQARLTAMANKERDRERTRLEGRRELHLANPILDDDICRNLNGEIIPVPNNRRNQPQGGAAGNDNVDQAGENQPRERPNNGSNDANTSRNQESRPQNGRNFSRDRRNRGPNNRSRSRSPSNGRRPNNRGQNRNPNQSNHRRDNSRGRNNNDCRGRGQSNGRNRSPRNAALNNQWDVQN